MALAGLVSALIGSHSFSLVIILHEKTSMLATLTSLLKGI